MYIFDLKMFEIGIFIHLGISKIGEL